MKQPLYITFTMDCERIQAESPPGGPATWGLSERAIRGYCERLIDCGMPPTLFLTPECAARHAKMIRALGDAGAQLGLHVHPESFLDGRWDKPIGMYNRAVQKNILKLARDMVAEAVGVIPTAFRSGNCSVNDDTFPILIELGFTHGSLSDPGRHAPNWAADWFDAYPWPYFVSSEAPGIRGDLPFVEVPTTTDRRDLKRNSSPQELRIERGPFASVHGPIIEYALAEMEREKPDIRTLCIMTHNTFAYTDATEPRTQTLIDIIDRIDELRNDYDVRTGSVGMVAEAFRRSVGVGAH